MSVTQSKPRRKTGPYRVLYIHPNTMGLPIEPAKNPLHHLSDHATGDYVAISIVRDAATSSELLRKINAASGSFRFHWLRTFMLPAGLRQLTDVLYFTGKGLALSIRHGRYDVVMSYGPYRTGLSAWLIARLTGARLILEMPGNPARSLSFEGGPLGRLKKSFSPRLVRFMVERADHIRLRYPDQLPDLPDRLRNRVSVFPNFIPMNSIPRGGATNDRYLLFIGYPWDLKGVDLLIAAFNRIWRRHPDVKLRIYGHCPDRSRYEEMRGDNPNIEFNGPVPHDEAMRLIAGCTAFVLASRTDAMARVLLEAMAACRPIIASAVDGIPYYIRHETTGLLFPSEDVDALSREMDRVLVDRAFAERLARRAHEYAMRELSEDRYAQTFRAMIERTIGLDVSDSFLAPPRPAAESS